jgi:hypothetical protein
MIFDAEGKKISPTMFRGFKDVASEARWHWKQQRALEEQAILLDEKKIKLKDAQQLRHIYIFGIACDWDDFIAPNEVVFTDKKGYEVGRIVNLEVSA